MARTNTKSVEPTLEAALQALPKRFRERLIGKYIELRAAFAQGSFDACGLRAGHFAESFLRLLQHDLTGSSIPFGEKTRSFVDECRKLERLPATSGPESFRVSVPQALTFLYTLRNKRGIGHVGGDVDANQIDAATAVRIADWCVCELIRVVHGIPLEEAQALLDAIAVRQLPQVWSVGGRRRVLDRSLNYKSQTLLLLYNEMQSAVPAEDLFDWTEYSNYSVYKRDVLRPLHAARLVEYDQETQTVTLSPLGIKKVEDDHIGHAAP
jgi:hypothetical protein